MAKKLPRENYTSTFTNANHNRTQAMRCFAVGMTGADVAKEWPMIWRVVKRGVDKGRIVQRYDRELSDGRLECDRMMLEIDEVIAAFVAANGGTK